MRLRPQAGFVEKEEGEEEEESGGGSGSGSGSTSGNSNSGGGEVIYDGCLPAFRLEREGIAIDEYHTRGDAPCEEELAKRVEAALSLSRREDAGQSLTAKPWFCVGSAVEGSPLPLHTHALPVPCGLVN